MLGKTSPMLINQNIWLSNTTALSFTTLSKCLINKYFTEQSYRNYYLRITFEIEMTNYTIKQDFPHFWKPATRDPIREVVSFCSIYWYQFS